MYKALRNKKTQKKIWIVLIIVIVPPFVLWGAGNYLKSQRQQNQAGYKIFGKKISDLELADSLQAIRNQATLQFGESLPEVQKMLNFEGQALERLILLSEARRRRLKTSDKEVIDYIQNFPFFQNKGQFSQSTYKYALNYIFHIQARVYEEQARQNLTIEKLFNAVTKDASVSEEETKDAYKKENEQISVYYIGAPLTDFSKDISVTDEELKTYYDKNSLSFKQPLSFNIEYLALITETKKDEIAMRLSKKESLESIVKEDGLTLKETGLFSQTDPIPEIGWSPEISEAISKLNVGQVSLPILVDKTYYIIRLKEKKEPFIPELEKIKDKVKETVGKEKAQAIAKEKIEKCLAFLKENTKDSAKPIDFDKAAEKFGLKSAATDLFKYNSYIENIGASEEFFTKAKALKDNAFSELITAPSGYYIIKLKMKVDIDESLYQKAKEGLKNKLLEGKRQEIFSEFYDELRKKALGK